MIEKLRVGFIGLGDMGGPIARRIVEGGCQTTLWARREASLAQFSDINFRTATNLVELGRLSNIVGICVFGDADVKETVLGEHGILAGMREGSVILIHSTVSGGAMREIERVAKEAGVDILDAPVSGSRVGAVEGKLAIMVGGKRRAFEKVLPLMKLYGGVIEHVGPLGSGQTMKVLNNVLGFANLSMAHRAIEIGESLGLDRQAVMKILRASSGGSFNLNVLIDRLLPDPAFAAHALSMVKKDTAIYGNILEEAGLGRSLIDAGAEDAIALLVRLGKIEQ